MLDTLQNLYLGFTVALAPTVFLYAVVGCIIGTLVGVLPGVGPLALGVSLLAAGGSYLLFAVWLKVPLPPGPWRS